MLLLLLMTEPLAAGERSPFVLVTPLAVDEEAFLPIRRNIAAADHRPFALVAPSTAEQNSAFAVADAKAGSTGVRWSAQASPSSPGEVAPIPFEVGKRTEPEPWPYALPFLADQVIKQGYTLPLPRGGSLVYTYVERDVKITKVKLGVDGAPLRDVTNFVNLGSNSHVNVAVGRFDAWLLPFLNVYAMAGYVSNNTTTKGIVTIPPLTSRGEPRTFKLLKTTDLGGFVGGSVSPRRPVGVSCSSSPTSTSARPTSGSTTRSAP